MVYGGWVLLVVSDASLRQMVAKELEARGSYQVCSASSAEHARALMGSARGPFDAVVLAQDLPDGDGRTVCAGWRRAGNWTPVVILSDSIEEEDAVLSFEAGADDHLPTDLPMAELVARLRCQLRATAGVLATQSYAMAG